MLTKTFVPCHSHVTSADKGHDLKRGKNEQKRFFFVSRDSKFSFSFHFAFDFCRKSFINLVLEHSSTPDPCPGGSNHAQLI